MTDAVKITVFGATGHAGRHITRLLLADERVEVTACARNADRLSELRASVEETAQGRLSPLPLDIRSRKDVEYAMLGADLVVGATSQWADGPELAELALRCDTSYLGLYLSQPDKWTRLRQLQGDCVDRGVMIVDDGGAHPGLPAALIRWVAAETPLCSAWVGAKFALKWDELNVARETVSDFVTEIKAMDLSLLQDGEWVRGYRYARAFDFGNGKGPQTCVPMGLEEIRELGHMGSMSSIGFFIAGFGPLVDYGFFPLSAGLATISPRRAADFMWWGLKRFASASEEAVLLLEAERASDGLPIRVRVSHADPYVLTAAPAVVTIHQMLENPRPGVWTQAMFVDPSDLIDKLQRMGISVKQQTYLSNSLFISDKHRVEDQL